MGKRGMEFDLVIIDGEIIYILKDQCMAAMQAVRKNPGEEKTELFTGLGKFGTTRIFKVKKKVEHVSTFKTETFFSSNNIVDERDVTHITEKVSGIKYLHAAVTEF